MTMASDAAATPSDGMGKIVEPSVANKTPVRILTILAAIAAAGYGTSFLPSAAVATVHVMASGIWLGVNVWTTFFAGITMFKNLERQTFGKLQSKLFPLYGVQMLHIYIFLASIQCCDSVTCAPDQFAMLGRKGRWYCGRLCSELADPKLSKDSKLWLMLHACGRKGWQDV
jgi:hypothetical protein